MKINVTSLLVDDQDKALSFYTEVLGDRLAGGAQPVPGRQPRADLEQGLVVSLGELIEDGPAGRVGQGPVQVGQRGTLYASGDLPVVSAQP